jgi:hypothetical protein
LIGGIAAVVIIIIFLIVVMMLCVVSKHSHSKVQRKRAVMNGYDVARPPDDRTSDTVHIIPYTTNSGDLQYSNGNISATHSIALASLIDNPVYTRADENAGCLYEVIPGEHTVPPVVDGQPRHIPSATSTQSTTVDYNDEELMGVYEVIIPPETTAGVSAELPVYASVPEAQQIHAIQAELSIAEKEAEAAQNMDLYIDMMTPKVPLISSDLEQYMSRRSTLSGGIYTEDINPSDFTRDGSQELGVEGEGDVQVYAPIYPALKVLPEGFQQPFEVSSDNIKVMEALRIGQFGEVVLATTNGLSLKDMRLSKIEESRDISIHVAVKKLKPQLPQIEQEDFNQETKFMSCLKHPNVVRLLGVCYYDPAFIMMEYMEEGDLSQFLQRYSEIVSIITCANNTSQITTSTLVFIASQIASAMKYLAAHNYIHRDLATRNCLVGGNFTIKLADFGMSRNLYESHYYRIQGNAILPIRWMATECFFGIFSEKTDVWAFGVTMWELFTLARDVPYPHLSDEEVIHNALKREYRHLPSRSAVCPQPVYDIMQQCWITDFQQRATFREANVMLQACT